MDESSVPPVSIDPAENRRRKQAGELYYAFTANLLAERRRCGIACQAFNTAPRFERRRRLVELWRDITADSSPLPPPVDDAEDDEDLLQDAPWVEAPVWMDYGYNVQLGEGVYVNTNSTWIDTCPITIGPRTLIGPNCSFYSGTHPTDPKVRNGTRGPELGKPIRIGADCWLGGNVTVLPGVTIGEGSTVGAGSVVTKDIPPRSVVAGNPARVLRKVY